MKKELIFWGVFSLFSLLLFEGACQLYEIYLLQLKNNYKSPMFVKKNEGSYKLKSNLNINLTVQGKKKVFKTNKSGFSWYDAELKKTKKRIAFIGDSFTQGYWANDFRSSFVGKVSNLSKEKKLDFEVLNFGVGGYGLNDEFLALKNSVIKYSPDIVCLAHYTHNDFSDTYLGKNKYNIIDGALYLDTVNLFEKIPEKYIYNANKYRKKPLERKRHYGHLLYSHSAFYRIISSFWAKQYNEVSNYDKYKFFKTDSIFHNESFWSLNHLPDIGLKAVNNYLTVLDSLTKYLNNKKIPLIIFVIPSKIQVYTEKVKDKEYNLNLPQEYLKNHVDTLNNVFYFDLLGSIRRIVHKENKDLYFSKDIHFNELGHNVVGQLVFEHLNGALKEIKQIK